LSKAQHKTKRQKNATDLRIVRVPGPYFTPEELDSLADIVARMILDDLQTRTKHQNHVGSKNGASIQT
jgi:hypothetical protein